AIFNMPPPMRPPPPPPGFPPPPGRPPIDFPYHERFDPEAGPGPGFLNAPGQATRTVGAVLRADGTVDAGVITRDGGRADVSSAPKVQLAAIVPNRRPYTVDLDRLGRYRVI